MGAAVLKKRFESVLGGPLEWQSRPAPELAPTGVSEVDNATGGLPRGCLTEIYGPASSGRTSLLVSILAQATAREEVCAVVDAEDAFDPASAAVAGVRLDRVLWVRCGHNAEHALKSADLLIQGGGFGVVALDLGDTPPQTARRISLTSWFRLRRAVEHTPTVLLAVAKQSNAKTCASLMLECERKGEKWSREKSGVNLPICLSAHKIGASKNSVSKTQSIRLEQSPHKKALLCGIRVHVMRRKPGSAVAASFSSSLHTE